MSRTTFIREITLYRYRYIISYGLFAVLLFGLLLFATGEIPRGISGGEMQSTVTSVNINLLNPKAENVIDAPYHLLQKASVQLFGLQPVSIRLPSIIIGVATGLGMIIMLQRWFKRNVAVLTAIIMSTSVGFLSMSRTGEALIMPTFWTVVLLLASTFVLHSRKVAYLWKSICFISVGLLLYSPLGVYPLIAMAVAGILHPHVRHRIKQGKVWQFLLIAVLFGIIVTPLAVAIVKDPHVGLKLLGLADLNLHPGYLFDNAKQALSGLFSVGQSQVGNIIKPIFGLTTAALLLLGFLKLCTATYSARSYMLFIWILLLVPVLILNPGAILIVITPAVLVMAIGIETLIREWYGLFPRNPYARIGALIPLAVLLGSVVTINIERYFYGNHYTVTDLSGYHRELPAIRKSAITHGLSYTTGDTRLVVPTNQVAFYDILRRENKHLHVSDQIGPQNGDGLLIVTADAKQKPTTEPYRIVTADTVHSGVLLRLYTKW